VYGEGTKNSVVYERIKDKVHAGVPALRKSLSSTVSHRETHLVRGERAGASLKSGTNFKLLLLEKHFATRKQIQ